MAASMLRTDSSCASPASQPGDVAVEPFDALLCPLVPEQIRKPLKMEIKAKMFVSAGDIPALALFRPGIPEKK